MFWKYISNFFKFFDPEFSHDFTIFCLKNGLHPKFKTPDIPFKLNILFFKNPIGLAAGFDKNALIINPLSKLGFGFCEIGTVTPRSQYGNKKPRIFRLKEDKAIINRNGFNNQGMFKIKKRLEFFRKNFKNKEQFVLGVNIGPNSDSSDRLKDFELMASELASYADYLSINVSSPNTSGLRNLQSKEKLGLVIHSVREGLKKNNKNFDQFPIFIKISPDISTKILNDAIKTCIKEKVLGLIISNTTVNRNMDLKSIHKNEVGGLSGEPLLKKSTETLLKANRILKKLNQNLFFIANGGVQDGYSAYIKILAGAHLIQLYTGLVYRGPSVAKDILFDLKRYMKRDSLDSFDEVRGLAKSFEEAKSIANEGL